MLRCCCLLLLMMAIHRVQPESTSPQSLLPTAVSFSLTAVVAVVVGAVDKSSDTAIQPKSPEDRAGTPEPTRNRHSI